METSNMLKRILNKQPRAAAPQNAEKEKAEILKLLPREFDIAVIGPL